MTRHGDVRRHVRKRLMGLATTIVITTIVAVGVLGTAMHKASKKLPVSPYVALAGRGAQLEEPEPFQPKLGASADEMLSADAILRRKLSRLRYEDERAVRRFLEEYHATGREIDRFRLNAFLDALTKVLAEDDRLELKRAVLAVFRRIPPGMLLDDPFALYLVNEDVELRRLAVMGYRAHDRDGQWKALAGLAGDPDASVRAAVAEALGGVRYDAAVDVLMGMLFDDDDQVVRVSGRALGLSLGRRLPDLFQKACESERAAVRLGAADALSIARGSAAAPMLSKFLQDPDWRIRRKAIQGLGRLRGPSAAVATRALTSVAGQVGMPRTDRFEAFQALAAMPSLTDPDRLRLVATTDPDPVLRLVAARTALAHDDVAVTNSLIRLMSVAQGDHCDEEDQEFVQATAAATLREAFEIEGPDDHNYTEATTRAKLRTMKGGSLAYSPRRLLEFW